MTIVNTSIVGGVRLRHSTPNKTIPAVKHRAITTYCSVPVEMVQNTVDLIITVADYFRVLHYSSKASVVT